jgi:hypothetical protein
LARVLFSFPSERAFEVNADEFVIDRVVTRFDKDHMFSVPSDPLPEGWTVMAAPVRTTGEWAEVPTAVATCDARKVFIQFATSTNGTMSKSFNVTAPDLGPGACCLVGRWVPTEEALQIETGIPNRDVTGTLASHGVSCKCEDARGGWSVQFLGDGTGSLTFEGNLNICTASQRGVEMRQESLHGGSQAFTWTTHENNGGRIDYDKNAVRWRFTICIMVHVHDMTPADAGPSIENSGFAYTCNGDAMTLQGLYGLLSPEAAHTRVVP